MRLKHSFYLLGISLISACKPDPSLQPTAPIINFYIPKGWPSPIYTFKDNPVSAATFELGRELFYDPRLSSDNSTSCGSCHQQFAAFAHADHNQSHGVQNRLGTRNSPGVFNMAWHPRFFWDGGVNHLELQPINPLEDPVEMDLNLADALKRLQSFPEYKQRFSDAFGTDEINDQRVLRAMAMFMALIISDKSKYDKVINGMPGYSFTSSENNGRQIFESKCASCHTPPLFTDLSFRNNGIGINTTFNDSGRMRITQDPADLYTFKVPSLRNLSFTKPYMHDGRFTTIDQVLDHYDHGVLASPTLDPLLKNGIQLSATERQELKAFLQTLDDPELLTDKRFSEPRR